MGNISGSLTKFTFKGKKFCFFFSTKNKNEKNKTKMKSDERNEESSIAFL